MRAALIAVAALSVLAAPVGATAANGPSSGVHIDPGSPAGKQYSLPIASARGETSGHPLASGAPSAVPFGAGVKPATPASAVPAASTLTAAPPASTRAAAARRRAAAQHASSTHQRPRARRPPAAPTTSSTRPARSRTRSAQAGVGESSWMPLLAGGALVLLLGGGIGLAIRGRT